MLHKEEIKIILIKQGWSDTGNGKYLTKRSGYHTCKVSFGSAGVMFEGRTSTSNKGRFRLLGTKRYDELSFDGRKINLS